MAKAKVIHSEDSCMIKFLGNKSNPEPSCGIIKFPGGQMEVSRTTDGEYWAHISVDASSNITDSRIDYDYETYNKTGGSIPPIPEQQGVEHIAIKVAVATNKGVKQ